jgi:hypothetical protein
MQSAGYSLPPLSEILYDLRTPFIGCAPVAPVSQRWSIIKYPFLYPGGCICRVPKLLHLGSLFQDSVALYRVEPLNIGLELRCL